MPGGRDGKVLFFVSPGLRGVDPDPVGVARPRVRCGHSGDRLWRESSALHGADVDQPGHGQDHRGRQPGGRGGYRRTGAGRSAVAHGARGLAEIGPRGWRGGGQHARVHLFLPPLPESLHQQAVAADQQRGTGPGTAGSAGPAGQCCAAHCAGDAGPRAVPGGGAAVLEGGAVSFPPGRGAHRHRYGPGRPAGESGGVFGRAAGNRSRSDYSAVALPRYRL